ncbi:MAG: SpoIIE family protein phosphatase [Agathobaculum sp.]|uniref:SpoIIE family protein phosphatase n=1 Tax=Agathobaculum sp. TaxID=2048138 RepID=UPI0025C5BE22|nr:SpoIIE family protein phosphatase [Agathobaculum sp.]MCI7125079.1 SpoIIE family protein phosphatase [Agathobaculum sp.]MDY3712370.1 SpoIIE family protein phosphatase [Agathobaculum sp.]
MDKQKTKRAAPQLLGRAAAWLAQLAGGEHGHVLIVGARRFVLCALLARGTVLGGYAPFGLAAASAMMAHGAGLSAIGGLFCGTMLLGGSLRSGVYAAAALLVLCVMSVCAGLKIIEKRWFAPLVATLAGAACTFVFLPVGPALTAASVLTFVAVQALTFGSCWVYSAAFAPPREENDWRRTATMLAFAASVLLSLADLDLFSLLSPARAAALLLVLASAYLGGAGFGAAAGVTFGAAMDLAAGQGALFTCCYGLCALVAGLFREQGRTWFALCALAAGLCAAMLGVDHVLFVPLILELLCAVAAFAALPEPVWRALRQTLLPDIPSGEAVRRRARQTVGQCATEAAQAFYEMYLSMLNGIHEGKAAGDQNVRVVFDHASERVCKSCVLCSQCWQRDYITTLAALNDVTQPMLRRGRAELSDFPQHFASRCVHLPELMRAINSALFALRERQSLRRQQEENQSLLARQYAGITDILRQLGAEVTRDEIAQPMLERQVRRYAAAFGWIDRVCAVRDGQGRLVIELFGQGTGDVLAQASGFAAGLGALLGVGLTEPKLVGEGEDAHLILRERAPFRAVVGIGRQQKEGASVSGDSGCYFVTDAGAACLLLADGMGTGAAAAQDSRMLVGSMERFLRAGISVGDALRAVSPALRLRSDGMRFATLDALTVDLFTGRAESLKCGAAPSYLRAGGRWTVLTAGALPIGLAEEDALGEPVPLRLGHGDLFVMLSDGVSDGADDGWVRALLEKHAGESPKELAARLVVEAKGRGHDDDRTALVMRLEKI